MAADNLLTLQELYERAEDDILRDMARRISTYDYFIPAAEHQRRVMLEMGYTHDYILERLSDLTHLSRGKLEDMLREASLDALQTDEGIYKAAGLKPAPMQDNPALQEIYAAGVKQTAGTFANLTRTTANTAAQQFEQALDTAWLGASSGAFSREEAISGAVKTLSDQGVKAITYPSGWSLTLEAAVAMCVRTGCNQTAARIRMARADELGCDLVEVTAHAGARPEHAVWQGKVYSRSGKSGKYPDLVKSTGYGTGAGLCGWNCGHSFFPYFEGMPRTYSENQLDELAAKKYEYNGERLTA